MNARGRLLSAVAAVFPLVLAFACTSERVVEVAVTREVEKVVEVPVTVVTDRVVEAPVTVEVERMVEVPVTVAVPIEPAPIQIVELVRTVEVPVTVLVEKMIEVEIPIEIPITVEVETRVEYPVTVEVERVVDRPVTVEVPVTVEPEKSVFRREPQTVSSGTLLAAVGLTYGISSSPRYCPACSVTARTGATETLLEAVRLQDGTIVASPLLARDWAMSSDGSSYTDFSLRRGVTFHGGYGEMTAKDVAFSWNDANPKIQPDSIHDTSRELTDLLHEVEVLSDYEVRFHWVAFGAHTLPQYLTNHWEGISIFSKRFFDEVGPEGMKQRLIGTGPFELDEWVAFEGISLNAVSNHWRKTPYVARANILQVPDSDVRVSMLRSARSHIAEIPVNQWRTLFDSGFVRAPEGLLGDSSIAFSGNYWEDELAFTREPLRSDVPGDLLYRPERDTSLPWVGDPDNPDSMERSKMVRTAMAMAIDREQLMREFTDGYGQVAYAPGWDVNHPFYKADWDIPYDVPGAQSLMAAAGFSEGFDVEWWAGPTVDSRETVHEAIAAEWLANLKINSSFDTQGYSDFRPSLVNRTNTKIFFSGGAASNPPTWPVGEFASTLTRPGGYNRGLEVPIFAQTYLAMVAETDPEVLRDLVTAMFDWNREWVLWAGVYQTPLAPIYNPASISEWAMLPEGKGVLGGINSLEWVRLAVR